MGLFYFKLPIFLQFTNVVVDIKDASGKLVYSNKIIKLVKVGAEYLSEPVSLGAGTHKLEKFIVTDQNNVALYATSVKGSRLAHLVKNPLEISFDIIKDQTKKIIPEVINIDNLTPADLGYATFGFTKVNALTSKISVFVYNPSKKNYELTKAKIKLYSADSLVINKELKDSTNMLVLKEKNTDYIILIQKSGYKAYINKFSKEELKGYTSNSLEIILKPNGQDRYTKLMIDGEGIDGKSFIYDNSYLLKPFDTHGAVTKTSIKKNGKSSIYFDGVNDYLSVPDSEDFNFGSGDFTVDFWINFSAVKPNGWTGIFSQRILHNNDNSFTLFYKTSASPQNVWQISLANSDGVTWVDYYSDPLLPAVNTWHHIAIVRKGTSLKLYYDGVTKINITLQAGQVLYNSTQPLVIGATNGGGFINHFFNGYIDDFRISKGIARWDGNFTP